MKKIIIGVVCFFSILANAEVKVHVDTSQLNLDESFRLVITEPDFQNASIPDLTPLQKDFIILGTEQRMNYSIINGQTQSSNEWIVTLKAQKKGKLSIPALKVGKEYTPPIPLDVAIGTKKEETSNLNQDENIFLTAEVNKKHPFVNQQIIYKVTLYNSKHLLNADYQAPQVENALLIPLGEGKRYQAQRGSVAYLVEEQAYAIYPQKSGTLTIKSPVFSALVYDFNPQKVRVHDKTLHLNIKAIPKEYSGKTWLPAKKIKLSEQYDLASSFIQQGNTLIRKVTIEGLGVPAQLLPNLTFPEIDGVNVYPEKSKDKNKIIKGDITGQSEIKITYLLNKPGRVILPELKLPWFNTETSREEIAILPAKIIEVTPSPTQATTSRTQPFLKSSTQDVQPPQKVDVFNKTETTWPWIIAAFFATAWLFTLAFGIKQRRVRRPTESSAKAVLHDLKKACKDSNPKQAREALIKWGKLQWPDASILNLNDLALLTTDDYFQKQIDALSKVLYRNQDKLLWRGNELWSTLQRIKKEKKKKKENLSPLPPINPSQGK